MSATVSTLRFDQEQFARKYRGITKRLSIPVRDNSTLGFQVADVEELARRKGLRFDRNAVIITSVARDGLANDENLRPGLLITQVRDRKVNSVEEFKAELRDASLADGILLLVKDPEDNSERFVVVRAYQ